MSADEEWLMAAEYHGSRANLKCKFSGERGIRTFDQRYACNTLDLSVIPAAIADRLAD